MCVRLKIRNKRFAGEIRQPENENCKRLYNLLRNRVNRELKKSKKKCYADYFIEHVNNIKKHGRASRILLTQRKLLIELLN